MKRLATLLAATGALAAGIAFAQAPLVVYSAGSLRAPLVEIGRQYEARTGTRVAFTFGASGLLEQRIESGEAVDVFASANTEHPEALARLGLAQPRACSPATSSAHSRCSQNSDLPRRPP